MDKQKTEEMDKSMYMGSIKTDELRYIVSSLKNKCTHGVNVISHSVKKELGIIDLSLPGSETGEKIFS